MCSCHLFLISSASVRSIPYHFGPLAVTDCAEAQGSLAERSFPSPKVRGRGREELPHTRGQRWRPGGATLYPRPGEVARRSNPMSEARSGSWEKQPHVQGVVAAWAQEGLEELSHVEGQEGQQ